MLGEQRLVRFFRLACSGHELVLRRVAAGERAGPKGLLSLVELLLLLHVDQSFATDGLQTPPELRLALVGLLLPVHPGIARLHPHVARPHAHRVLEVELVLFVVPVVPKRYADHVACWVGIVQRGGICGLAVLLIPADVEQLPAVLRVLEEEDVKHPRREFHLQIGHVVAPGRVPQGVLQRARPSVEPPHLVGLVGVLALHLQPHVVTEVVPQELRVVAQPLVGHIRAEHLVDVQVLHLLLDPRAYELAQRSGHEEHAQPRVLQLGVGLDRATATIRRVLRVFQVQEHEERIDPVQRALALCRDPFLVIGHQLDRRLVHRSKRRRSVRRPVLVAPRKVGQEDIHVRKSLVEP